MKAIKKQFAKYVSLNIFGMIGISIYILADTFFISVAGGADGLAVLNLALPIYGIIFAVGQMVGIGASIRYSLDKSTGALNTSTYFTNAIIWNLIFSIPFIILGIICPTKIIALMGGDSYIQSLGQSYFRIFMIFAAFFMLNHTCNAFVRNDNDPTLGMIASLSGSIFNIVFDYIFMFPCHMGLKGAALATGVSPIIGILVSCIHFCGQKNTIKFKLSLPSVRLLLSYCRLGFAAFIGELSSAITTTIFNLLIISITGNIGVAAYGVIANYSLVAMAIFNGTAQGSQPLISKFYGEGNYETANKIKKLGIITTIMIESIIITLSWLFTDTFVAVFNSEGNPGLAALAHDGFRLYFLGFILAGINVFIISYFAATDNPGKSFFASITRGVLAISICSIVLAKIFGMNGVWISFLFAELITFILIIFLDKNHSSHKKGLSR